MQIMMVVTRTVKKDPTEMRAIAVGDKCPDVWFLVGGAEDVSRGPVDKDVSVAAGDTLDGMRNAFVGRGGNPEVTVAVGATTGKIPVCTESVDPAVFAGISVIPASGAGLGTALTSTSVVGFLN